MKKIIGIGVAIMLLLVLLAWAFMPTPVEVEIATVTQGRFERSVQEDGKTRLRERYVVSTPLMGRVARIQLKQGDAVQRDDIVATLWPVAPSLLDERSRAEQVARIGAMQAGVARAQANVARASVSLDQARAELNRNQILAQQGFISSKQNESEQLTVRVREKELDIAHQEAAAALYEMAQSRIALKQFSQAPLNTLEGPQRAFDIKAPVSGRVLKIVQQSEGIVMAGTSLMELGDPTQLEVVVDVLTEDVAQIRPGTAVQLSNWGGVESLEGLVRLIEPAAFTKISALGVEEQRVNVVIDLTSPPEKWQTLGDGFKIDVRVLVQVVENAIKIPVSALFPVGSRSALFVMTYGRAHLQEVAVAARNGVEAWVKSGLTPGTQVIIYPDNKLRDGHRVKPREVKSR